MAGRARTRVLIFVLDGLRPDMVRPETMPTLRKFADDGVWFRRSRAVFPSETRVNQASLVTGCLPARHGIVGNKFFDAGVWPDRLINSGDEDHLYAAHQALAGALLDVPSLGELLAAQGLSLAVVGTGTPGGTRILNHRAESLGQLRFSLYRPDRSTPAATIDSIVDRFGPIPEQAVPATARLRYGADVYLGQVAREIDADVTILWSFEPDWSYHFSGLGTADNLQALRCADEQLARILAFREEAGLADSLQIFTLSDHGHVSTRGDALDIVGKLRADGWRAGRAFDEDTDVAVFCSTTGGCYLREPSDERIAALAAWFDRQPWCGPVFANTPTARFKLDDVYISHRRAPQVVFIANSDDACNPRGIAGESLHDAPELAPGGGMHGGLHPREMNNWLAIQGSRFLSRRVFDSPAGIIDVLPTVFAALQLDAPSAIDGRVLAEAMSTDAGVEHQSHDRSAGGFTLHRQNVGTTRYLDCISVD